MHIESHIAVIESTGVEGAPGRMDKGMERLPVDRLGLWEIKELQREKKFLQDSGFSYEIYVKLLRVHLVHIMCQILVGIVELIEENRFL